MKTRKLLGVLLVLIVLGLVAWLLATKRSGQDETIYVVRFDDAKNLQPGAPIRYVGLTVGRVREVSLTPDQRAVEARISVDSKLELGTDAQFVVTTEGLLGEGLLEIYDLGEGERLSPGGVLHAVPRKTVDLETLVKLLSKPDEELNSINRRLERIEEKMDFLLARLE